MDVRDIVGIAGAPVVVALVHVLKVWITDERWWPLLSILAGIALNLALTAALGAGNYGTAAIVGLVTGLVASGAYSATRTTLALGK